MLECQPLLTELRRLTIRLSDIVERDFSMLGADQINWKPSEDKWSIAQCLLHLNYYAEYYFPGAQAILQRGQRRLLKPTITYTKGRYGRKCIADVRLQRDNKIRVTLEATSKLTPTSSQIDGQQELKKFLGYQQQLEQMIIIAQGLPLGKVRIPFGFWGLCRIKLGDILQVFVYHVERHVVQAQRVHYHDDFPHSK